MKADTVVVTGGTYGIGRAIAMRLAEGGWRVVAFGLDAPQPASVAADTVAPMREEVARRALPVVVLEADVSDADDVARVVSVAGEGGHQVHGLVNNAAIGPLGTVLDTVPALFDHVLSVNLRGPYLMCRALIPAMAETGGGSIVNVGSGAGWGKPNMAAYAASKGGLFALTKALALDHFHQRIRVNAVVPGGGGIETGMSLGRVGGDRSRLGRGAPGTVAGRPASGDDVAHAVAFLLSDAAETVSGTVIDVGCFSGQGAGPPPLADPLPAAS